MHWPKKLRKSLLGKLLLMNFLTLMTVLTMLFVNHLVARNVGRAIVTLTQTDVERLTQNASLSALLHQALADIEKLTNTFMLHENQLQAMKEPLLALTVQIGENGMMQKEERLKEVFGIFQHHLDALLEQSDLVMARAHAIAAIGKDIEGRFDTLDETIGKMIIANQSTGKKDKIAQLKRLSTLLPVFRMLFLQAQRRLDYTKSAHTAPVNEREKHEARLEAFLDALERQLTATISAGGRIRPQGVLLSARIADYRTAVKALGSALDDFQHRLLMLMQARGVMLATVAAINRKVMDESRQMQSRLAWQLAYAGRMAFLFSGVILLIGLIGSGLFVYRIIRPINQLSGEVQRLQERFGLEIGDFEGDEIERFALSFESMAGELERKTVSITELVKAQRRFEDVAETTGDWIWEIDTKGVYTYTSPVVEKVLGYFPAEVRGRSVQDFFHPESRAVQEADLRQRLKARQPFINYESENLSRSNDLVIIESAGVPVVDAHEAFKGFRGVSRNITGRRLTEQHIALLNRELQEAYRSAGMSVIATGILHNVGNVLNSVNVSADMIATTVRRLPHNGLGQLADLLKRHISDLGSFFTADHRGQQVLPYLEKLADQVGCDQAALISELEHLQISIAHIKKIIAMQQGYAGTRAIKAEVALIEVLEDALKVTATSIKRLHIQIRKDYQILPRLLLDKHNLLQICINVIRNAQQALSESVARPRQLTIGIAPVDDKIRMTFADNGVGIAAATIGHIFTHGFTTRRDGHGFGLHSSALAAHELGGRLWAESPGPGLGATFILELPAS